MACPPPGDPVEDPLIPVRIDRMPGAGHGMATGRPTVGILFSGEMGSTIGRLLIQRGLRVVTTLEGRGDRSVQLCHSAGLETLESVCDVVNQADVIISVVTPAAATAVAQLVAMSLSMRHARTLYVDINSISPVTLAEVGTILDCPNLELVDAAIHGLASRLMEDGTLYLSGQASAEVAALFGGVPRTILLGDEVGRASLLKMLIGGVNKGVVALLLELSDVAKKEGMLDQFLAVCRVSYPGVMDLFERLLPTYPLHARRRGEEMAELELTVSAAGRQPVMAAAVRSLIESVSRSPGDLQSLLECVTATQPTQAG
jgi:3-hydroxyisobutyrate dehydrogenase-like beta-hydroxyacid dehydrogenase